jgi:hypothetical protein
MAETLEQPTDPVDLKVRAGDFGLATVTRRYLEVLGICPAENGVGP